MILDGKKVRDEYLEKLKVKISENNLKLKLVIISVGNHEASKVYVNNKVKYASFAHIDAEVINMPFETRESDVINLIEKLNNDKSVTGFILQSPVPKHINIENCIKHINPLKDVDGFCESNFYKLSRNIDGLRPCTSMGIIKLLDYYNILLSGKKVCIIGRGNIAGKPLMFEFLNRDASVSIVHSKTHDLKEYTLNSDIIVSAVGKKHLITKDMVKKDSIIIDVGINVIDGKIYGDVDFDNVKDISLYITPNPGGVGPMTVLCLLENVLKAYYLQNGEDINGWKNKKDYWKRKS